MTVKSNINLSDTVQVTGIRKPEQSSMEKSRWDNREIFSRFDMGQQIVKKDEIICALMNAAVDLIMLVGKNGRVEIINNAGAEWFDKTPEQMEGRNIYDYFTRQELKVFNRVLVNKEPLAFEHENNEKLFYNNYYPVFDENNNLMYIAVYVKNITKARMVERELINISENERQAIGQDLHDGVGQELTASVYMLKTMKNRIEHNKPVSVSLVEEVQTLLRGTVKKIRKISHDMMPFLMQNSNILQAVKSMLDNVQDVFNVNCTLVTKGELFLDELVATNLYYIIREAVNNAVKHGDGRQITVIIDSQDSRFFIRVQNTIAKEFNEDFRECSTGIGLDIMRYRANIIKADFTIDITNSLFSIEIKQR